MRGASCGTSPTEEQIMADTYALGSANTTPHIHVYSGGDCHIKFAGGDRVDLIKNHVRVPQARLNEVFDRIRSEYPDAQNQTRVAALAALGGVLRNVAIHQSDR